MVLKKRFNYGFDFTNIPKAPRSRRRKVSSKRLDDDDVTQICAIDLLASIAGKLLEESESSSTSYEEDNHHHEDGYNENTSETFSCLENDCIVEQTLVSDCKKAHGLMLLAGCEINKEDCDFLVEETAVEGHENQSKLVCRDDDENYCKFYKLSDRSKSYRPLTSVRNRRIKKYSRAVPRLKCLEDSRTDGCLKALNRKRKSCYGYSKTIHRKRRLSEKGLVINSDGGLSSESVCNSPEKEGLVKFSIKSLKIPELFIEVPETATVGSLKRTVMEAVTALLDDGISIGMSVQGKKVKDDNNTLSQTGLSCKENLDNLGFTLEPVISMQTDSTNLSERSTASPVLESCPIQDSDHLINSGSRVKISHELVPYQSDISADEQPSSESRALVPVSSLESENLAIVSVNEKPKRIETSQRRTRRPFSVIEVEALVQAVEEIGTGRWRDVKLCSFENATHRTYVDLKDKWKTLVHTATISPQQRRGETVPQELLDRVLAAHRYWSPHQMKQNLKH